MCPEVSCLDSSVNRWNEIHRFARSQVVLGVPVKDSFCKFLCIGWRKISGTIIIIVFGILQSRVGDW